MSGPVSRPASLCVHTGTSADMTPLHAAGHFSQSRRRGPLWVSPGTLSDDIYGRRMRSPRAVRPDQRGHLPHLPACPLGVHNRMAPRDERRDKEDLP
jgi:hypothetical protein